MEAKDTVMTDKQIEDAWDKASIGLTFTDLKLIAQAQADISFKAGMQEVVNCVMEHQSVPHELDLMKATDRQLIAEGIAKQYPGTDLEVDIDWGVIDIAFKVGFDVGLSRAMEAAEETYGAQIDDGKRAGMREVVNWVNNRNAKGYLSHCGFSHIWRAKLQEWGLTEGSDV